MSVSKCLILIWLLGIAVRLFRILIDLMKTYAHRKKITAIHSPQLGEVTCALYRDNPRLKKCEIVVTDAVNVPQIVGFISPVIYLPNYSFSDQELKYIILHELTHHRCKDMWLKLLSSTICALLWWNPFAHLVCRDIDLLLEMKCDLRVTEEMTNEDCLSYFETVVGLMKKLSLPASTVPMNSLAFASGCSEISVTRRFNSLITERESQRKPMVLSSLILLCLAFSLSFVLLLQPAIYPPPDELVGVRVITRETSYIFEHKDGSRVLVVDNTVIYVLADEDLKTEPFSTLEIRKES